jgi:hypothetical protein
MREKKTWRKTINQTDVHETFEKSNRQKEISDHSKRIKDSELFKINVEKGNL